MTKLNEEEKKPWQSKRPLFPTYLLLSFHMEKNRNKHNRKLMELFLTSIPVIKLKTFKGDQS